MSDRVRQGESLSDIVREALERYLEACPTSCLTPHPSPSVSPGIASRQLSDTLSALSATLSDVVAAVSDIQSRLARLESPPDARPAPWSTRQTRRQTASDTPAFDSTRHRLGRLCPRGHDWQSTGQSLRVRNKAGYCLACQAEDARASRAAHRQRQEG